MAPAASAIPTSRIANGQCWTRPLDIHLDQRFRPQRAHDDVARNALQLLRVLPLSAGQLPHQAMVEAELLDFAVAYAVSAAVADVADPDAFRAEKDGGGGGPH